MLEREQKLVSEAKKGNSESFGVLYDHYLPKIYRFILVKTSHREQAEDLTHQTFLKAWEGISGYNDKGHPFGSWLYRIARNTVVDHYRKNKIRISIEDVSPEALGIDDSLTANLEIKFEWREVLGAMRDLSEVEQDILIMRFVEDMPHTEVAKAVNKSESAVKVIQHRAIKKLKETLTK